MTMKISAPAGMSGLAVEPWSEGEVYAVAADWAQASCCVMVYGKDGWTPESHGRQVADFRHNDRAALESLIREAISMGGDKPDDDEVETILDAAEEIEPEPDFDSIDWSRADWSRVDAIAAFTACVYGHDGDEPGEVRVVLESATEGDITAYRWAEQDDGGTRETGDPTKDRDEAVAGGEEYASENDEEPDADDLIQQIVDTGYFGSADADDICAVCQAATEHSQGYLLLPKGEFVGHPIGRMWTTNGYLQCEYVSLDATYPSVAYAADALLRAVTAVASEAE
jgi:hypothetical protein